MVNHDMHNYFDVTLIFCLTDLDLTGDIIYGDDYLWFTQRIMKDT